MAMAMSMAMLTPTLAMRSSSLSALTPPSPDPLCTLHLKIFIPLQGGICCKGLADLRPRAECLEQFHMVPKKPQGQVHAVVCGPGTQNRGTIAARTEVRGPRSSPWTRVLARAAVTHLATGPIVVPAPQAGPIPGRAVRPRTPPPPPENQVAAQWANPIAWPPLLHPVPLCAARTPLREAQVYGAAIDASPAVSLDPFMSVQFPWLRVRLRAGVRGRRTWDLGARTARRSGAAGRRLRTWDLEPRRPPRRGQTARRSGAAGRGLRTWDLELHRPPGRGHLLGGRLRGRALALGSRLSLGSRTPGATRLSRWLGSRTPGATPNSRWLFRLLLLLLPYLLQELQVQGLRLHGLDETWKLLGVVECSTADLG